MKNFLLCISILIYSSNFHSQIWVHDNAVWHYDFSTGFSGGFIKIEHTQDTLLDSKNAKMFVSTKYEFAYDQNNVLNLIDNSIIDSNYTWVNGDTVFYWQNEQFEILYNFANSLGDSWIIDHDGETYYECSDTSTVEIINEGTINLSGIDYTSFELYSADSSYMKLRGNYNARFGAHSTDFSLFNYLFPISSICDPSIIIDFASFQFKCFEDDSLSYNPSGEDCEYLLTHLGISDLNNFNSKIYPNPNNGEFIIESTNQSEIENLAIRDIQGKLVICTFEITPDNRNHIIVEKAVPGIYFVSYKSNGVTIVSKLMIR